MLNKVETNQTPQKKEEIQYEENYKNICISSGICDGICTSGTSNAAEKAAVNQEKAQATVQAGSFTHRVQSLYYNSSTKKAFF